MIDWWLIVSMNILVFALAFHTYLASLVSKAKEQPVMNLLDSKIFTVKSANNNAETNTNEKPESEHYKKYMKKARLMNNFAKVAFIGFLVIFNIIFWIVAINEYVKPAENYITDPDTV